VWNVAVQQAEVPVRQAEVPAVTGPVSLSVVAAGTAVGAWKTGAEYLDFLKFHAFARFTSWGVDVQLPYEEETFDDRIARMARARPQVESPLPAHPPLSGNLIDDVRAICGLTTQQVADAVGVTERRVLGLRKDKIPEERRPVLEALRAVGLTLVGGLGPAGVARWLTAGNPSALDLLKQGKVDEVRARVQRYEDSDAT
jgi:hypothetical protein